MSMWLSLSIAVAMSWCQGDSSPKFPRCCWLSEGHRRLLVCTSTNFALRKHP
jgi:hypothetical protein